MVSFSFFQRNDCASSWTSLWVKDLAKQSVLKSFQKYFKYELLLNELQSNANIQLEKADFHIWSAGQQLRWLYFIFIHSSKTALNLFLRN